MKRFLFEITGEYEGSVEYDNESDIFVPSEPVIEYKPLEIINILTNISSGFIILKKHKGDFVIIEAQKKEFTVTHTDDHDVVGCYFHDVHPLLTKAGMEEIFEKTYTTGKTIKYRTTIYDSGRPINITDHVCFKNANAVFLYSDDITRTYISRALNKELFNNPLIGIMETNSDKQVVRTNETFTKLTGYTREEINEIGFANIITEYYNRNPQIKSYSVCFKSFFNSEISVCNAEIKIKTKNGEEKWLQQNCNMIYTDEGLIQTRLIDITKTKESQIKAERLEKMLDQISQISKTGIIIADRESIVYTPEFYKLVEITAEEYGANFPAYVDEEDREDLIKFMQSITREEPTGIKTFKYHTPIGEIKYLTFFVKDIYSKNGEPGYTYNMWGSEFNKDDGFDTAVLLLQDVTEIALKEIKLEEHNLEKEVLLKEIHHRVKNNLQLISSFLNLEENYKSKDAQELLNITKSRVNGIALLHEKTYESEDLVNINVEEYITEQFSNLIKTYSSKDIDLIFDIDPTLTSTLPKLTNLGLIINELFTNTIKYAFDENIEHKEVTLSIHKEGDEVIFTYKDNGKGFPANFDIEDLSSLGVMLIIQLTKQLDGTVEVTNDNGAKYIITFKADENE